MKKVLRFRVAASAVFLLCIATVIAARAQTFTTLASFDGTNGLDSLSTLVEGLDGNLYGTTSIGGSSDCSLGCGTVFKITPGGTLTTLHLFDSTDGSKPYAGLLLATEGAFAGTTAYGGAYGFGTFFKLTTAGKLTMLASVDNAPDARLIQATDGNFYGTSLFGGNNFGDVFRITTGGTLTSLFSFQYPSGEAPYGGLIQASDGKLYGTTARGGANAAGTAGTIFRITLEGALRTIYNFCAQANCPDGYHPSTPLVQSADGNFYGTTFDGGPSNNCSDGCGTVFKISPAGTLTTLHIFDGSDGGGPTAGLVQGTDGNFYGTTIEGGTSNNCPDGCGTVFKITPGGTLITLHSFDRTDGESPYGGLVQASNGIFYGTTEYGGINTDGTVFSLSMGLGPFVKTLPTRGTVGEKVIIQGTNLIGATAVTFNGSAAVFTVVSKTEITTVVPTGATSGKVTVATPHGTLSSNVPFRVRP